MSEEKKNGKLLDNLFKLPFFKKLKNVKHIEIIICIIFISLLLLIYFYGFKPNGKTTITSSKQVTENVLYTKTTDYSRELEGKLKTVISSLKGVSNVSVMVSVNSGGEVVIANTTTEKEELTSSGERKSVTTTKTPIIVTENGENKPIILSEILPKLKGVIVVAKGAEDVNVKLNIYKILETMTELTSENIQVFAGK